MNPPPYGLSVPCKWLRNIDADTVEVRTVMGHIAKVRLMDCYAPEMDTEEGKKAKAFLDELLSNWEDWLCLFIPLPKDTDGDKELGLHELFRGAISFDRVLGRLWMGSVEISHYLVTCEHATREKP